MKIRVLLVNKSPTRLRKYEEFLQQSFSSISIEGMAESIEDVLLILTSKEVNLIIIDETIDSTKGYELFEYCSNELFHIIFTDCESFYPEMMKVLPIGCLTKPIKMRDLKTMVNRQLKILFLQMKMMLW